MDPRTVKPANVIKDQSIGGMVWYCTRADESEAECGGGDNKYEIIYRKACELDEENGLDISAEFQVFYKSR